MLNDALITYNKTDEIKPQLALIADNVVIRVVTVAEYAERHGYSQRYVRLLCDIGRLHAVKYQSYWLILQTPVTKISATG